MGSYIFILAPVMMMAGLFGGVINYYQMNQEDSDPAAVARCVVIGIGAAFLVPLVLHLLKSELIFEIQGDPSKLLIYTGICLFAAIASRIVITNTSQRLLNEAAVARSQLASLQHELRQLQEELVPLIDTETEQDLGGDDNSAALEGSENLDVTSTKVLQALGCGRHIFRSLAGLCREAQCDDSTMTKTLNVLVAQNLAGKINGTKGLRWYLTQRGRQLTERIV